MESVPTDSELVRSAQQGDREAFRELVTRHEGRVYRVALRMLRDPQDAEDVLQETFINVHRHLGSFRGDSEFSTWVYRIAANASLMKLRSRKPVVSLDEPFPESEGESPPHEIVDWSATPEQVLLNGEVHEQMERALQDLPEIHRLVFVLRDVEGMSIEETARALNISVPNVKTRLHRARLALRASLSAYFAGRGRAADVRKEMNE